MAAANSAQVRSALDAAVAAIGGQPRDGQIEMAEAVANALADRHHLLVQAGTGTGKSLAYLVPALVHGKKVLVATATLALQRQLVERDLPRIQKALEKELNDLTVKSDRNNNDDPNAQMVKKLKLENDKLNYRIGILERSIEEANSSSAKNSANPTIVQSMLFQ